MLANPTPEVNFANISEQIGLANGVDCKKCHSLSPTKLRLTRKFTKLQKNPTITLQASRGVF
jgi:hypothetical protein